MHYCISAFCHLLIFFFFACAQNKKKKKDKKMTKKSANLFWQFLFFYCVVFVSHSFDLPSAIRRSSSIIRRSIISRTKNKFYLINSMLHSLNKHIFRVSHLFSVQSIWQWKFLHSFHCLFVIIFSFSFFCLSTFHKKNSKK